MTVLKGSGYSLPTKTTFVKVNITVLRIPDSGEGTGAVCGWGVKKYKRCLK